MSEQLVDLVNHPPHYNTGATCDCGKPIECIVVTERMNFNLGNAMKYLWRSDHKGAPVEDLRKALWYVNREIERRSLLENSDQSPLFDN